MYQRDSLIRIVLLSLLVYALLSLAAVKREIDTLELTVSALASEAAELEAENQQLSSQLLHGYSEDEMLSLARNRLGLVLPGEKVFYFYSDREE